MIEQLKLGKKYNSNLIDFISSKNTLYITKDGKRVKISTLKDLRALLRECSFAIQKREGTIITGLLFVWKSDYLGNKRSYVKAVYNEVRDLDDLLMMLNWTFPREVYSKIDKERLAVDSFRKKGFKICTERGEEVLLFRSRNDRRFFAPIKDEDIEEEVE